MVEAFQNALLRVCLLALALLVPVLVASSRRLRYPSAALLAAFSRLPLPAKAVASIVFLVCMAIGGSKTNAPPRMLSLAAPQPSQAEWKAANWSLRGAWKDSFWLDFESGWFFPWGTNHLSGVEVVSFGEVWATPFDTNAVASAGAPFEIVPGLTSFSFEHTPSNSYRLSWTDAAVGRDTNSLVSAAIELFRNGDVAVATNGVAAHFPRMLPFPHDGFGQDAEWVAANFTNATEILAAGYPEWVDAQVGHGLLNGLYKLTVSVPEVPPETSWIHVGGLSVAVTNSGDYVFLLEKGTRYELSVFPHDFTNCAYSAVDDVMPTRSLPSGLDEGEWTEDGGSVELVIPQFPLVPFSPTAHILWKPTLCVSPSTWQPAPYSRERTFTAVVSDAPWFMPSPSFSWSSAGDAPVSVGNPSSAVATVACAFPAAYGKSVELRLAARIGSMELESTFCASVEDFGVGDSSSAYDADEGPYLAVDASPSAVFFEKGTANTDSAAFACWYNVDAPGAFTLAMSDGACTVKDFEFNDVQSGYSWHVDEPSSGARHFTVYNSIRSSSASGTVFSVEFTPDAGAESMADSTGIVFVEWETETQATWPSDRSRRTLGVCEEVEIRLNPQPQGIALESETAGAVLNDKGSGVWEYIASLDPVTDTISAAGCGQLFNFDVLMPSGYNAKLTTIECDPTKGVAGAFGMRFALTLLPTNVSFSALQLMEVGMTSTNAIGYFAEARNSVLLSHSTSAGANVWVGVLSENKGTDWAQLPELQLPWGAGGSMTWPIPNKYRKDSSHSSLSGDGISGRWFCNTDQHFSLGSDGTATETKFDWFTTVTTNRVINYGRLAAP